MDEDRWRNLEVWQIADNLAYNIYIITRKFPKEEMFSLTSQVRRAALSVPTNIVEGYSRRGDKELKHFINISLGSLAETKYLLYFSCRVGYLTSEEYQPLKKETDLLGKKLWRFYEKIQ